MRWLGGGEVGTIAPRPWRRSSDGSSAGGDNGIGPFMLFATGAASDDRSFFFFFSSSGTTAPPHQNLGEDVGRRTNAGCAPGRDGDRLGARAGTWGHGYAAEAATRAREWADKER